jgi:endonuclease/exonuclease/phosphatase (EEP) superfamily protein YafD
MRPSGPRRIAGFLDAATNKLAALSTLRRPPGRRRRLALIALAVYPGALAVPLVIQLGAQARSGPLALAAIIAPYCFLPLVAISPFLLLRGSRALRLAVIACLLCGLPFAPRLQIGPATTARPGTTLTVTTWNVAFGHADGDAVRRFVESRPADIVALEEDYNIWWDSDYARWIEREAGLARIYPHQIRLHPLGLTLLSVYPLLESSVTEGGAGEASAPPVIWGRFDLGQGRSVVVAAAHPRNPTRGGCDPRRLCYDPAARDAEIREVRATVAPFLAQGEPLILAGDFNLTEREPAYRDLIAGLWDAHAVTGNGFGHTWRPFGLARLGLPLLRIDYLLGSPGIWPLDLSSDCTPRGTDHCALTATIALP